MRRILTLLFFLFLFLSLAQSFAQTSFSLPGDGNWYRVATVGGQHAYLEYGYWHGTPYNPSVSKGEIEFINAKNHAMQHHQTMGYSAWNQLQFAIVNQGSNEELWVKATSGVSAGTFKIERYQNCTIDGVTNDSDLSNNGGTLTVYEKLRDDSHTFNHTVDIQGGPLNIGGSGAIDAALQIKSAFGNFDRLTQMSPSVANKPALNLMASKSSSGEDQWWAWGVTPDNKWRIHTGTQFGSGGLAIDQNGKTFFGGYEGGAGTSNSYSIEVGGSNPTNNSGQATIFFHHHGMIAHQFRYSAGSFFLEAAGNGYGTNTTPNFFVGGSVGIGNTNPGSYKLAVDGKIGAREVNVTTSSWSDYVFDDHYTLLPLDQLQTYIKENKHLPDVPSETEVLKNGQDLGAMNAVLLRKIEELTLYMIELKKENEAQNQIIEKLLKSKR